MSQWIIYVMVVLPCTESVVVAIGGSDYGTSKLVRPFHFWILFFSVIIAILFYKLEERKERFMKTLSTLTVSFSAMDLGLHFVDDFSLLMDFTRIVTDGLFFALFLICMLKFTIKAVYYFISYYRSPKNMMKSQYLINT